MDIYRHAQHVFKVRITPFWIFYIILMFKMNMFWTVAYPGILFGGGSTNSVEDRGQREWGSGGRSPLVRGSAQFANE
jgi:hypothetical protein